MKFLDFESHAHISVTSPLMRNTKVSSFHDKAQKMNSKCVFSSVFVVIVGIYDVGVIGSLDRSITW